ncbi:winged helix-turn-helix domain-containing protein [Salidesulfovibrio brasiliensis]|uniref:winged helix-turn-helix domain-containing protein n=1 Tax=Salidesulfovibrio brasiliensis TaxID=221711 RepID=UPI0006D27D9A|nr:LysR family transcriptional regulator [Salidesulfovibrio brasiliensis]
MTKRKSGATLRLRVWIEEEQDLYIGIGSTLLLKKIDELGSLKKASEELGMSYRRAWGKLKKTENRVGTKLVTKIPGQGQRFALSDEGRDLMERFLAFYVDVERYARKRASEILEKEIRPSHEFGLSDTE